MRPIPQHHNETVLTHFAGKLPLGGIINLGLRDGHVAVSVTATACTSLEVAEAMTWLGLAYRAAETPLDPICFEPVIDGRGGKPCHVQYRSLRAAENYNQERGTCWYALLRNPAIAHGYPIPKRDFGEQGCEVSLPLMSTLGCTSRITSYEGRTFVGGVRTLFAPKKRTETSIVWHFLAVPKGQCLSYNDGVKEAGFHEVIEPSELSNLRHFVGYTARADILAGKFELPSRLQWLESLTVEIKKEPTTLATIIHLVEQRRLDPRMLASTQ